MDSGVAILPGGLTCLATGHSGSTLRGGDCDLRLAEFWVWRFESKNLLNSSTLLGVNMLFLSPWCLPFSARPWTPCRSWASGWLASGFRRRRSGTWRCWLRGQPGASCPSVRAWSKKELLWVQTQNLVTDNKGIPTELKGLKRKMLNNSGCFLLLFSLGFLDHITFWGKTLWECTHTCYYNCKKMVQRGKLALLPCSESDAAWMSYALCQKQMGDSGFQKILRHNNIKSRKHELALLSFGFTFANVDTYLCKSSHT